MTHLSVGRKVTYTSDGPQLQNEAVNPAMGQNTAIAPAGHMLITPAQGIGPNLGHGYEDELVD